MRPDESRQESDAADPRHLCLAIVQGTGDEAIGLVDIITGRNRYFWKATWRGKGGIGIQAEEIDEAEMVWEVEESPKHIHALKPETYKHATGLGKRNFTDEIKDTDLNRERLLWVIQVSSV